MESTKARRNNPKDVDATASTSSSSLSSLTDEIFPIGKEEIDASELIDPASTSVSIDTTKEKMSTNAKTTTSEYCNGHSNSNTGYAGRKRKGTQKSNEKIASMSSSLPSIYNLDSPVQPHAASDPQEDTGLQDGQGKKTVPSNDAVASRTTTLEITNISIPTIADSNKARKRTKISTPSSSSSLKASSVVHSEASSISSPTTRSSDRQQQQQRPVCRNDQHPVPRRSTDLMHKILLELQIIGHDCFGKVFDDTDLYDLR